MAHREELALNEALLVVLIEFSCTTLSRGSQPKVRQESILPIARPLRQVWCGGVKF